MTSEYWIANALVEAEKRLKDMGFRGGAIEFLLDNPCLDTGSFVIRHVTVVDKDMSSRYSGDGGYNYRTDIYAIDLKDGTHYYKIRCLFDSWDTRDWDISSIDEVRQTTKKVIVWEEV